MNHILLRRVSIIKKASIVLSIFVLSVLFAGFMRESVFARTATQIPSSIMDKAIFQGVYKCYTGGYVVSSLSPLDSYSDISSLMTGNSGGNFVPLVSGVNSSSIWTTTRYQIKDSGLSCKQLFTGGSYSFGGSNSSILTATNHPAPARNNSESLKTFLQNMGYDITTTGGDTCYSLSLTVNTITSTSTNKVCKSSDGKLYTEGDGTSDAQFKLSGSNNVCLYLPSRGSFPSQVGKCTAVDAGSFNGESLISVVRTACGAMNCKQSEGQGTYTTYSFDSTADGSSAQDSMTNSTAAFIENNSSSAALKALSFLSDGQFTDSGSIAISDIEKRFLYQTYLESYYGVTIDCSDGLSDAAFDGKINWFDPNNNTMKTCHYDKSTAKNQNKPVNGISGGSFAYESIANLEALLVEFETIPVDYTEEEIAQLTELSREGTEGASSSKTAKTCSTGGGSKALGWIVCPVLTWIAEAANDVYDDYVAPNLAINTELFSRDNATREAWGSFQIIANVFFVIIFLISIISQLTGAGIDNYGLKRNLPRLAIAAILINLSYYICVAAIDLSSIVGSALGGVFESLTPTSTATISYSGSGGADSITVTALTGAGILGAIVAGGAAIWASPAILISLLVSAIGVGISIFTLFILLSVRQAVVVILVVISPLAIAAYTLPGTKKFFDTWLRVLEALLLVYPITVVLVKGGNYVSALLMTSGFAGGGFAAAFSAMVISIAPVFFVPQILKSSFAGIGNIGAKISGIGNNVRRTTTGATQRAIITSRRWKEFDQNHKIGIERRHAGRVINRLGGRDASTLSDAQKRRLTAALATQTSQRKEDNRLAAEQKRYETYDPAAEAKALEAEADKEMVANAEILLRDQTRGGEDVIALWGDAKNPSSISSSKFGVARAAYLAATTDEERQKQMTIMKAIANIAGGRKDTAKAFMASLAADSYSSKDEMTLVHSLSKAVAAGAGAKKFRAANGGNYEWLSTINRMSENDIDDLLANGKDANFNSGDLNFSTFISKSDNVDRAIERHITNAGELYGQSNEALNQLYANASAAYQARLQAMATTARDEAILSGGYDATKDTTIYNIAHPVMGPALGEAQVRTKIAQEASATHNAQAMHNARLEQSMHEMNATQQGRTETIGGYSGTYYRAPQGWTLDPSRSTATNPVFQNPDDPSQAYDASTNRFL